ncbi:MAG: dihydrolipoyl dehydrogenase [Candidatus Eisenbacteria bacterium]|nr:dihydrolipoyl dehydrogenase [Candidatus Eisenbacteria bacterium]
MSQPYDIAIIGAGPGGYVAAIRAAQLGMRAVIVEKEESLGGTCLNWGCIPTKALLHAAEMVEGIGGMKPYGVSVKEHAFDWSALQRRKKAVVTKNTKGIEFLMKKNGVDVIRGAGRIASPGKIAVTPAGGEASEVEAKQIIVATGSRIASIRGADFDGKSVISSDDALMLEELPKSMVVLGGGAVGVEFASLFHGFGVKVTLVEMLPTLNPLGDAEVGAELGRALKKRGIDVRVGTKFASLSGGSEGPLDVVMEKEGGEKETVRAEKLLVAVGRRPVTEGIGLEEAGVKIERGFVSVGPRMETAVKGIYAIGDIVPTPALAHVASEEGVVAVEMIAGRDPKPIHYDRVPACVYTTPEVAWVGLTEEQAKEGGREIRIGRFPFSANSKASVAGAPAGFVKLIADAKYGEILGAHLIGHHVTEMVSGLAALMEAEGDIDGLARTIHPHPTLSEAIHEAALDAAGEGPIHI